GCRRRPARGSVPVRRSCGSRVCGMDQSLHDRLEQLHAELSGINAVDPAERELLTRLMADIRHVLDEPPPAGHEREYGALSGRWRAGLPRLEASSPTAALVMGQVVDALANLGL